MVAEVFVNAHAPHVPSVLFREVGSDQAQVAGKCHERIGDIGAALAGPVTAVGVDVGNRLELLLAAEFPEAGKAFALNGDEPRIECVRIEIVIVDDSGDAIGTRDSQQEGSALATVLAATAKFQDELTPQEAVDLGCHSGMG